MRKNIVLRYLGLVLLLNSMFLIISALISYFHNGAGFSALAYSALITFLFGIFPIIFVPPTRTISHLEGIFIVVAGWLIACSIGMIPYIIWGGEFTITNAWFESVSGFTTTGSSILTNIEALPEGLLFWRSSTHWIGGIGIIVLVLAIMPAIGQTAAGILYRSEISPAAQRQFKMRSKDAIRVIVYIYIGLTALETIALMLSGLSLFDAVNHSFASIATGGFSTKNTSIAAYNNLAVEIVIMVFMLLAGMNFLLLFSVLFKDFKNLIISTVLKYYLAFNLIAILLVSLNTYHSNYNSFAEALRYSAFQVLSIGTSSGFASADSSIYPPFAQLIILYLTFQCACAGSTSGGIKADRIIIFFKSLVRKIKQIQHPNAVFSVFLEKRKVDDNVIESSIIYIIIYVIVVLLTAMILTLLNVDLLSAFSAAAASMGNVGPGLSTVGSFDNYSHIPLLGKWLLSFTMILGRLEIYALIIFLIPKNWK
ncbi:MAG: TrkH family potassium uptake protein [Ignavibacteriae bacterium]|nr:TrkH family potassium uptake protein [Ignavibacteriota bacterium]NOG99193.1 TrkH family potassium uptake protein [Ignavibacteriota bacterium]